MAYVRLKGSAWHVYYRLAGGRWTSTTTTAKSKTEAKRLAGELERREERRRLGLDPLPSDTTTTFWALCDWWLEHRCGERSRDVERARLGKHIRGTALGELPLGQVTKSALEDRLREMERAGAEPGSLNTLRGRLHTVIARASAEEPPLWSGPNPVEKVASRRRGKKVYAVLTPPEVGPTLAHATRGWRGEIACAVYAALRKGEVFGLRKEDVDLRGRTMTVRRSYDHPSTKTDEEATIPIPAPLLPYLEAALANAPGELVFPGRRGEMRTKEADPEKALRRAMARAGLVLGYNHVCRRCKAAGKPAAEHTWRHPDAGERRCAACSMLLWPVAVPRRTRFHDLRHSSATILLTAGVPMQHVQRILRHANVSTTVDLYGHMVAEHVRVAMDAAWGPSDPPTIGQPPPAQKAEGPVAPETSGTTGPSEWALQGLNLRPLPCEGSALPLS
jgi:integrase